MKYRRKGKEQLLTFGQWPELSLTDARARRDQVREQLRRGVDIKVNSAGAGEISTFEQLARAWHERRQPRWSPSMRPTSSPASSATSSRRSATRIRARSPPRTSSPS
jgi:hypothetical protein